MMQVIKQLTKSIFVLATVAGCANAPSTDFDNDEQIVIESKSRTKNTMLAISGILLLGAIIANAAEDGARDAVRDATRP